MDMPSSADLATYQPPRLRVLGSVHDVTRGGVQVARSDGVLFQGQGGGYVNGS